MRLTYYHKCLLYRNNCYAINPPPVPHAQWTEESWIKYIDSGEGRWYNLDALPEFIAEDQKRRPSREFLVASVSNNRNSFGLKGIILVCPTGEAWEVGMSHAPKKGQTIMLPTVGDKVQFHLAGMQGLTIEIPKRLTDAPESVLCELFPEVRTKDGHCVA